MLLQNEVAEATGNSRASKEEKRRKQRTSVKHCISPGVKAMKFSCSQSFSIASKRSFAFVSVTNGDVVGSQPLGELMCNS